MDQPPDAPTPRPDFGPSGYLPERASKRARKIVLRAPLGLQWIVASLVAGVVVVVAGAIFLSASGDAPGEPFVAIGPLSELATVTSTDVAGRELNIVNAGGRTRAFVASGAAGLSYCQPANRLLSPGGGVWLPTGRGIAGTPSLDEVPLTVVDGIAYVDPTTTVPGPPSSDEAPGDLSECEATTPSP